MNFALNQSLRKSVKKYAADPMRSYIASILSHGKIPLFWFCEPNWGDSLNPVLIELLAGKPAKLVRQHYCNRYMAIGSNLGNAFSRTTVWGAGFIEEGEMVQEPPKAIFAVRGPLTRAALIKAGIDCPEVYGDPALLLPYFYNPEVTLKYEIGIIPHYVDKKHKWIKKQGELTGVCIIDVAGDIFEFVRSVKSCKTILSSSLHGLICADAYGIPNTWIKCSENVIGGSFKFSDYRLSIKAELPSPEHISDSSDSRKIAAKAKSYILDIDLLKLLLACPFLGSEIRARAESVISADGKLPDKFFSDVFESYQRIW